MRVIFVGIHNKPGLQPLDSSTLTGKTVDAVIARLGAHHCVKMNLFDLDYKPKKKEGYGLIHKFTERSKIEPGDILVLLGKDVQGYLLGVYTCPVVDMAHPANVMSKWDRQAYIDIMERRIRRFMPTDNLPSLP